MGNFVSYTLYRTSELRDQSLILPAGGFSFLLQGFVQIWFATRWVLLTPLSCWNSLFSTLCNIRYLCKCRHCNNNHKFHQNKSVSSFVICLTADFYGA
jgi:hypothetical protein